MQKIEYVETRRVDDVEVLAGVSFPDPYRWLEGNDDEVRQWQRAQAKLASEHVRRWPHFEALKRQVARLHVGRFASRPVKAGGRWFWMATPEGAAQASVFVAEAPFGDGHVLFDPASEDAGAPPFLTWISPSPDGRTLALGVCADGSENNVMRLIDVATGARIAGAPTQLLMDGWLGGPQWLADASGFFYPALGEDKHDFRQAIYFHRLGNAPPVEPEPIPIPSGSRDYRGVMVSRCGRWAVAVHRILTPIPVAVRDFDNPQGEWRPFITDIAGVVAGHVLGDRYVAVTDIDAPRGRVVAISLDSPTPNDPASWEEIVPESDAVIRSLTPVGDRLFVSELVDTYARVRIFEKDGALHGEVPLPGKGGVAEMPFPMMNLFANPPADAFVFSFSSFTRSWGYYRYLPDTGRCETLVEPALALENAVVEDHWATSADGVRIPYHVVRRTDVDPTVPQPTLIYAYGAGGASLNPQFPGPMAAFVEAGGVFVHAHLRGGGEFGLDWWRGGTVKNRQRGYDDLFTVAEDLIARGATAPRLLGVTGGSSGGLLSGVAITQRPDLWRVVIPRVPVLDLIAACREPYGRYVAELEYGDPDDPDELRRIAGFSPYHLISDGTVYPAVYIDAGDTDPRCPPWHARKFAARLQAAQAGEDHILLHVWENVGHGWATGKDIQIEETSEWLGFAMQHLGLEPSPAPDLEQAPSDEKPRSAQEAVAAARQ